jgi:epoxyqueuosine reductase
VTRTSLESSERVLAMCREAGFALAGVCPVAPSARASELRAWLSEGLHGEMAWLAETVEERIDPARLLDGARSVVMVAARYAPRGTAHDARTPGRGRIARYARGRYYHRVCKARLHRICDAVRAEHPGAQTRAFCDTAPVPERELAELCGLGWIGKHTLLIHPGLGSWMVLAGFLTTLELEPPPETAPVADQCGSCTRCIDACPTGAIRPYSVDATRCISYLTIEHGGPIEPPLGEAVGDWVFGCDVCQEVCPHNAVGRRLGPEGEADPDLAPRRSGFDLLDVLGWDEPTRRGRFSGSAMKRASLAQMKRNAVWVALDAARTEPAAAEALRRRLTDIAWDASEPELVRSAARGALTRLGAGA